MNQMTVREAGKIGGQRTKERHGHDFYVEIGKKGGQKVRNLIEMGKQKEANNVRDDHA